MSPPSTISSSASGGVLHPDEQNGIAATVGMHDDITKGMSYEEFRCYKCQQACL